MLRLPRHASNFQLMHRFNGNLRRGFSANNAGNLFGLDRARPSASILIRHRPAVAAVIASPSTRRSSSRQVGRGAPGRALGLALGAGVGRGRGQLPGALRAGAGPRSRSTGGRFARDVPRWIGCNNTAALLGVQRDTFFVGAGGACASARTRTSSAGGAAPRRLPSQHAARLRRRRRAGGTCSN